MEIVVEYGTMLHVRYPPPIVASSESDGGDGEGGEAASSARDDDDNGLVSVIVHRPVLYSASVGLERAGHDDGGSMAGRLAYYALRSDDNDVVGDDPTTTTTMNARPPLDPIVVRVAAGIDGDYWSVTIATMTSALIGGLLVMRGLDSISIWD